MGVSDDEPYQGRPVPAVPPPRTAPEDDPVYVPDLAGLGPDERLAVLADDLLIEQIRLGERGHDDPDPLVRFLLGLRLAMLRSAAGAALPKRQCRSGWDRRRYRRPGR